MTDEELNNQLPEDADVGLREAGGFAAGLLVGALLGAAVALLFAPDRGSRTRGRLGRRLRRLRDDAAEELEDRGGRARRDLARRRRQLRRQLERARERLS